MNPSIQEYLFNQIDFHIKINFRMEKNIPGDQSHRESQTAKIVDCMIYAQDWLRASSMPIDVEENLEPLEVIETSGKYIFTY